MVVVAAGSYRVVSANLHFLNGEPMLNLVVSRAKGKVSKRGILRTEESKSYTLYADPMCSCFFFL